MRLVTSCACRGLLLVLCLSCLILIPSKVCGNGVGSVVPGTVVLRFTPVATPPPSLVQLMPAQVGIAAIDDVLAALADAELVPLLGQRHPNPSPERDVLERTFILRFSAEMNPDSIVGLLDEFSEFEEVRVDRYVRAYYFGTRRHIPPDSEFPPNGSLGGQWSLDSQADDRQDIDGPEAWEIERGEPSLVIGITDSGTMVDTTGSNPWKLHSDIERLYNAAEDSLSPGRLSYDDIDQSDSVTDSDSEHDNVIGYNFTPPARHGTQFEKAVWRAMPIDVILNDPLSKTDPWKIMFYYPHGLSVESIAASREGGEGPSVCGVAPQCKVYHVRTSLTPDPTVAFDFENPVFLASPTLDAAVIVHAAIHTSVINMSWGYDELTIDAIQQLHAAVSVATDSPSVGGYDCVLVAAVGNISEIEPDEVVYPARFPQVMGVGNMNKTLGRFYDSAFGPEVGYVSVVAPVDHGVPVESHTQCGTEGGIGNYPCPLEESITLFGGTSAAAPQVTGLAKVPPVFVPGNVRVHVSSYV